MWTLRIAGFIFLFSVSIMGSGCGLFVKKTKIAVPKAVLQAKNATLEELLRIVNRNDEIQTLRSRYKLKYLSEKNENGLIELKKYPRAPGYFLLRRPDSIYLVISNPVLKKSMVSIVSVGDDFSVWRHDESILYKGKNSTRELISDDLEENPNIRIRAPHIWDAVLPKGIPIHDPEIRYSIMEEDVTEKDGITEKDVVVAKNYVLCVYRSTSSSFLHPLRKFWIERSGLTISRQQMYNDEGRVESDIYYSEAIQKEGFALPLKIRIERPLDGYTLELEFKAEDWQINPDFKDIDFEMKPPSGVKVIHFK
jgi:outer membrane lipoprotein-sorting protein